MARLRTFSAASDDTSAAVSQLRSQLAGSSARSRLAFVFYGQQHDGLAIGDLMRDALPATPFLGGTSSAGLLCSGELLDGRSIGLLTIEDDAGHYGVAAGSLGSNPAAAARRALLAALDDDDCPGELPQLV